MPNWVKSVVKFDAKKYSTIFEKYVIPEKGENGETLYFDLNKIVPEPKTVEECPVDCRMTVNSHAQTLDEKPWFDWYAWHRKYWGTKWGTCSNEVDLQKGRIKFETAWNTPEKALEALAKKESELQCKIYFADEDYGGSNGYYEIKDGHLIPHYINDEAYAVLVWDEE